MRTRGGGNVPGNRRGFTLIELLIVIAIIALLVAILFPIARTAVERADRSTCLSNLHQIALGISVYQQDHSTYPEATGTVWTHGVPDCGITSLALGNSALPVEAFWCKKDTFPDRFPNTPGTIPQRDLTDSSYAFGYNYYGYVTTTEGTPFPVTTKEAALYFFGAKEDVDLTTFLKAPRPGGFEMNPAQLAAYRNRNLELVKTVFKKMPTGNTAVGYRSLGLFQGLWNFNTPTNTIITHCPYHGGGFNQTIPAVTISGNATYYEVPNPKKDAPGEASRTPNPPGSKRVVPIDWRLNKAAFVENGSKNQPSNTLMGDAPRNLNATSMPVVKVYYRQFTAGQMAGLMVGGYGFYNTGVPVQPGDMVMVIANAKWTWNRLYSFPFNSLDPYNATNAFCQNQSYYVGVADDESRILFNADGDPIEKKYSPSPNPSLLNNKQYHCVLIGYLGDPLTGTIDPNLVYPLGSRGSILAPTAGKLLLSLNDINGAGAYDDNDGWCEVQIAVYRP